MFDRRRDWRLNAIHIRHRVFILAEARERGDTLSGSVSRRHLRPFEQNLAAFIIARLAIFATSSLFLVSYLYYHYHVGSVHFRGTGWTRPLYFSILISHTTLAVVIVPMILITLTRGLREQFDKHRAIARWTFPLWLYVSITGVIVYLMLYQIFV